MDRTTGMDAYKAVLDNTLMGRQMEAHVLLKSAARLQQVIDNWGSPGHEARLRDTVYRTQMLWSIFQAALASPDNALARETKKSLLSLSLFIDRRLIATLADPAPDKLTPIIDIHRDLAAGLSTSSARPAGE